MECVHVERADDKSLYSKQINNHPKRILLARFKPLGELSPLDQRPTPYFTQTADWVNALPPTAAGHDAMLTVTCRFSKRILLIEGQTTCLNIGSVTSGALHSGATSTVVALVHSSTTNPTWRDFIDSCHLVQPTFIVCFASRSVSGTPSRHPDRIFLSIRYCDDCMLETRHVSRNNGQCILQSLLLSD